MQREEYEELKRLQAIWEAEKVNKLCNCGSHKLAPLYHKPDCPALWPRSDIAEEV